MPLRRGLPLAMRGRCLAGALLISGVLLSLTPARSHAQASSPSSPFGTEVRVTSNTRWLRGELLSVSSDSIWIETDSVTVALARDGITMVEYRRHKFGARRARTIGFAIAGATTLGIAAACSSPEVGGDANCGSVTVGWLAITSGLALLSSVLANNAEWRALPLDQWDQLVAHARFPQGLPASSQPKAVPPPA